jgi:hypothetical protein
MAATFIQRRPVARRRRVNPFSTLSRAGLCQSAWGPDADRHAKLLIHLAVEGSTLINIGDDEWAFGTVRRLLLLTPRVSRELLARAALVFAVREAVRLNFGA